MIPKRRLFVNASAGFVQVVVVGLTFLVVYRYVKDALGISQFGVWALVLATVSVNHIANLGVASATVKFVPMYLAREAAAETVKVIETSVVTLGVFLAIVLPIAYPFLLFVIRKSVEPELYPLAKLVLPYALVSFWMNALSSVLQGCVDGYQRVDLRSYLVSGASLVYLLLVFWLVGTNGLEGLAQAQLIQAVLLLTSLWMLLRRLDANLPWLPFHWSYLTFRETLGYSMTFQGIGLAKLLFEPTTKVLLARFAGSATLGYFEFAHRMVFQLRSLVVTAYQAVVPTIADLQERQPELIRNIYTESLRFLLFVVGPALVFFILLTPIVSKLWIGSFVTEFVLFSGLVFAAWFLNILVSPAYFSNAGTGHLRWNFLGHLVTGVLNVLLGFALGYQFGGTGVVVAFSIALVTGGAVTVAAYHARNELSFASFSDPKTNRLLVFCGLVLVVGEMIFFQFGDTQYGSLLHGIVPALFVLIIARSVWSHPQRVKLFAAARSIVLRNQDSNVAALDDH